MKTDTPKIKKTPPDKPTKAQRRQKLIMEVSNLDNELQYLEYKIPFLLEKIKKLKPTKIEMEEDGLQELYDQYL